MKTVVLVSLLYSVSFAQSIETLIQSAYKNNYTLKIMQKDININTQNLKNSDSWDNPVLSVGLTDLQLDQIDDRTLEPMQTQYITLSQKIPLANKKGILKDISKQKIKLSSLALDDKKAKISSDITLLAYQSVIIDEKLKLIKKRVANLKKMKKLTLAYQEDADKSFMIDLKVLKLDNKAQTLEFKQEEIIQKIQKFTVEPISNIDANLNFKSLPKIDLNNNSKLALVKQQIEIAKKRVTLMKAKRTPDLKVSGGYFQRDNRDDYLNLSFAMPLPIGDSEEVEVIKSQLEVNKMEYSLNNLLNNFENEIKSLQIKAKKAHKNYTRLNQEILPKQKKIIKLLKTKNRMGKIKLTEVLKSSNTSLDIEELALLELQEYFEAYARLRYYQ